tara:strand:+ start:4440 stop:7205 length:2766 start_codon:yes stop_codon:yes gene_type:complete
MSVQLILKPQNVQGFTNDISFISANMVVNGETFNGVDGATGYTATSGSVVQEVLDNAPATIPNTWYKFKQTASVSFPTTTSNNLVFTNDPEDNLIGIYQQLTDLIVGQVYTVTIYLSATPVDYVFFLQPEETSGIMASTEIFSGTGTTQTCQFTAQMENPTIFFSAFSTGSSVTTISVFNITVVGASESITILSGNGEVICDLYEDEDLPLTLSVDEFKNVAEKVQSYSKAFMLPATKRNNRIFDAIFEITRAYDGLIFNPYRRTECILKQDGFILFQGYLRLIEIIDKEGEISYNVNLYSEVVALADVLKDRKFRDLDFTELEHDYNRIQIGYSWNDSGTGITYTNPSTSGFRNAYSTVKYPFVDWNHQYATGSTGNPQLINLESSFRPFINIKYLIDRIFNAPNTPFTYTSDFFNTTDFKKLYMDFNWGSDNSPSLSETNTINKEYKTDSFATNFAPNSSYGDLRIVPIISSPPTTVPDSLLLQVDYNSVTNKITATQDNVYYSIDFWYQIKATSVSAADPQYKARWLITRASGVEEEINLTPLTTLLDQEVDLYSGNTNVILNFNDTLEPQFFSTETNSIFQNFDSISPQPLVTSSLTINKSILSLTTETILQTLRGELEQWDFLKGLMTMFNLVTLVDEDNPNNIIIEPYKDVFIPDATAGSTLANRGIVHDWTDKIDVSQMKLTPLTDLNLSTTFKFVEDDEDYAFNQYKNLVEGHLYGSYLSDAGIEFNILDGEDEIVAEPFAATVVKPLMEQFPEFIVPQIYSYNSDDSTTEGFDNSPRIMYNNGVVNVGTDYHIPAQNGETSININTALQFSHLSIIPTDTDTRDFHFGICQLFPGVGSATVNNLFNIYWKPYFNELYNPDTRIMTIQVNLSPADVNTFKFNSTVYIKNRTFRVNKIDYKPNDLATVEFILIP